MPEMAGFRVRPGHTIPSAVAPRGPPTITNHFRSFKSLLEDHGPDEALAWTEDDVRCRSRQTLPQLRKDRDIFCELQAS